MAATEERSREELRRDAREARAKKQKRKRLIFDILIVLIVLIVGLVLSLTVFFNISSIDVEGQSQYSDEEIRNASGLGTGDNLFLIDRSAVAEHIEERLPYTGTVTVKRSLPGTLVITVTDSSIRTAVQTKKGYILIDGNNKVLEKVASKKALKKAIAVQAEKKAAAEAKGKKTASKTTAASTASANASESTSGTTAAKSTTTAESTTAASTKSTASGSLNSVMILKGLQVSSSAVGNTLEVSNPKTMTQYNELLSLLKKNKINDITSMDLTNLSEMVMTYQNRLEIILGSSAGLEKKMEFCKTVLEAQNAISTTQVGTINVSISGRAYFSEGTTVSTASATAAAEESKTSETPSSASSSGTSETTAEETAAASQTTDSYGGDADVGG